MTWISVPDDKSLLRYLMTKVALLMSVLFPTVIVFTARAWSFCYCL